MAWGVCSRMRAATFGDHLGPVLAGGLAEQLGQHHLGHEVVALGQHPLGHLQPVAPCLVAVGGGLGVEQDEPADPVGVVAQKGQGYIAPEGQPAEHDPVEAAVVQQPEQVIGQQVHAGLLDRLVLRGPEPPQVGDDHLVAAGQGLDLGRPHAPVEREGVQ